MITIEVCCASYEDVAIAEKAGAHRVELNSAMFLGGLTPSYGEVKLTKQNTKIPVMAMIRPRAAGFCYSDTEYEVMLEDSKEFIKLGVEGLVFGFLTAEGKIDEGRTKRLVEICGDRDAVFHRAFDVTPNPLEALEALISCGVKRILTSGGAPNAPDGAAMLKRLLETADGRIEILPGGGVRAHNAKLLIEKTGVNQLHFSAMEKRAEPSVRRSDIHFGGALYLSENEVNVASEDKIVNLIKSI